MKDRVSLYPGRVTLAPVAGQANTYDMVRADQPTQEGSALNKAFFLPDELAAALGLSGDDPSVKDALRALLDANGDVLDEVNKIRTDLLGEINVSSQTQNISINVSDINWSDYSYVYIDYRLVADKQDTVGVVRANNTSSGTCRRLSDTSNTSNAFASVLIGSSSGSGGYGRLVMQTHNGNSDRVTALVLPSYTPALCYGSVDVMFSSLTTINFVMLDSGLKFTTACKFKILGVR